MITTGNVELDAAFEELQKQIAFLSGECAAKAGKLAVALMEKDALRKELEQCRNSKAAQT